MISELRRLQSELDMASLGIAENRTEIDKNYLTGLLIRVDLMMKEVLDYINECSNKGGTQLFYDLYVTKKHLTR